uniref:Uncharacterized protein n=1 Tax=Cyprinodon variegatus TaxID=28743 RepID=A0A3Q2ECF6_CYPVA
MALLADKSLIRDEKKRQSKELCLVSIPLIHTAFTVMREKSLRLCLNIWTVKVLGEMIFKSSPVRFCFDDTPTSCTYMQVTAQPIHFSTIQLQVSSHLDSNPIIYLSVLHHQRLSRTRNTASQGYLDGKEPAGIYLERTSLILPKTSGENKTGHSLY